MESIMESISGANPGEARPDWNPYIRDCPSRQVLDRIGDRWSMLIIATLGEGTHRYSDLARRIEGISQKMLTQTLRGLERDGLIHRTVYPEVPLRVEYRLTALGDSLLGAILGLAQWATAHMGEIIEARARHDREPPRDPIVPEPQLGRPRSR